jgi:hypothetical protein
MQRVLKLCEAQRLISLPFQVGGRGGRQVFFTGTQADPRAIPVISAAVDGLAAVCEAPGEEEPSTVEVGPDSSRRSNQRP